MSSRLGCLCVLAAILWLGIAPYSNAADPPAGADSHAASHEKPGPFKQALDLTIWTIVVFLVLLLVLKRFAWKPMLDGLQKREANINEAIENARKARQEAEAVRVQYQKELANAHQEVRDLIAEARRDAEHTKEGLMADARNEIQAERERLRREIGTAKDQALKELWDQSARLATLISSKAIGRELKVDDHRRLFDEAVDELSAANVGWRDRLF